MYRIAFVVAIPILAPLHGWTEAFRSSLFPLTCSQKMCSTSVLLSRFLWIMYLTGISGNPWFSDFQCKPSSHPSPLLSISVFPALGVHFTLDREKFRDHHTEWRRVDSSYIMGCNGEVGYKNPQQWAPRQRLNGYPTWQETYGKQRTLVDGGGIYGAWS